MADSTFDSFLKLLDVAVAQSSTPGEAFAFDRADGVSSWNDLFKACDRTELIRQLKAAVQKECLARDFVPNASRVDYLSASERDLRLRSRNRIQAKIVASSAAVSDFQRKGIIQYSKELTGIEANV